MAASVARGLEEALSEAEPPAFVSAAIEDARGAAERALEAAARAEEEALEGFAERETLTKKTELKKTKKTL